MFMSPFRKGPRHRFPTREYLEMEQQIRRERHRRSDTLLFAALIIAPIILFGAYELGRMTLFMRGVQAFAATIDQCPPADVKRDLQNYAKHLTDWNPALRNGSMMALKIATGWNPGNSPVDWRQMWAEQEPYWEYRHTAVTNAPPPDWRAKLPEKLPAP